MILNLLPVLAFASVPPSSPQTAPYGDLLLRIGDGSWTDTHAILVVREGELILDDYFLGDDAEMLQDIRSCTKSFASALVGIAIDRGYLESVDQRLMEFFPEYSRPSDWDPRKDEITLRHMLTMSWGIDAPDFESSESFTSIERYRPGWVQELLSLPVAYEPGTRYVYSSAATCMFAPILERATGMPLEEFADRYLFRPLGIEHYRWSRLPDGYPMIGGALWIRPEEWLRLGLLYLHGGVWNGQRIVSTEWIRESTHPQIEVSPEIDLHYGYYWATDHFRIHGTWYEAFHHTGHGGSILGVVPELDMVFAVKGSAHDNPWHNLRTRALLDSFVMPSVVPPADGKPFDRSWRGYPWVPIVLSFSICTAGVVVWSLAIWRGGRQALRWIATINLLYSLACGFLLLALLQSYGEMRYLPNVDYPATVVGMKRFLIHTLPRLVAGGIPVLAVITALALFGRWWSPLRRLYQVLTTAAGLGLVLVLLYMRLW